MNKDPFIHMCSAGLLIAGLCLMPACETRGGLGEGREPEISCPWPTDQPPLHLKQLAEELSAYRDMSLTWPDTLADLEASRQTTLPEEVLAGYVYEPQGVGIVGDGWQVIVVDSRPHAPGYVWCVLRPPIRPSNGQRLYVALMPMRVLDGVAQRAGGTMRVD